ncbi:MAG: hypothetical protein K0U72_12960 [Gammaproteobacteria bacterium]|nr:hypothetical protein [Gammaproteobacteria bacterium]
MQTVSDIPPLIATSVVRGSAQGQSHGGVYILDSATQSVQQMIDWNTADIDWAGRGWDRGLRGIAFWNEEVYIAASDELFVYDQQFKPLRSYRNAYLKHCHEIVVYDNKLYLTSTGFDSVLMFDLPSGEFLWGLHAAKLDGRWHAHKFDPRTDVGPPARNQHHINSVDVSTDGLSFAGLRTQGIVGLSPDATLQQQVDLPEGIHNARLTPSGVIFNDTAANYLRMVERNGDERRFAFPTYAEAELDQAGIDDSKLARQGFGRGLCVINERLVAAGSSPSTVTVFDLISGETVFSVNFSMDIRNAIHGLEVWPYAVPVSAA